MSLTARLITSLAVLACCATAAMAAAQAPVARVTGGMLQGAIDSGQAVFKNIPFAAPPIGDLRWREPQSVRAWTGTRDASAFGPACIQRTGGAEDCLTLNVWAPEWPSSSPKPVMVWFHGGGNREGGANARLYQGTSLAAHGVVVVTVQYRLGVFGFFAHPELSKESAHGASGNYALLDQIAALEWVRDNIASFGGDPGTVTIFGESAGAEDVGILLVSPLAKGLFHRAIAESGPLRKIYPSLSEQEAQCAGLASALGIPSADQIAHLRKASAGTLLLTSLSQPNRCRPVNLDGHVLVEQPLKLYAEGKQHPVPFMLGNTLREGFTAMNAAALRTAIRAQYGAGAPRVLAAYGAGDGQTPVDDLLHGDAAVQYGTDQAHRCRVVLTGMQHAATGQPFYQFEFARDLPGRKPNSSTHADELAYVFGEPAMSDWGLEQAEDKALSRQMQAYWTNFAKTGDPNGAGLPRWNAFDAEARAYMAFPVEGASPGEGLRRVQCDLFLENETARPTWLHPERAAR